MLEMHRKFMDQALPRLQADPRIIGVAGAGSLITGKMDPYSDLDLVVVCRDGDLDALAAERFRLVESLGTLLSAFSGEHVGVPMLLICLYDDPLLHVDVKLVSLGELAERIENPVILWEREGSLSAVIDKTEPRHPMPDLQWIEDRYWTWVHYAAQRLGRGELFEVIDFLSFLRQTVLGPLSLVEHGQLPRGVRRLETLAPGNLEALKSTVAGYDHASCVAAIRAAIRLYRELRERARSPSLVRREAAEKAAVRYFEQVAGVGSRSA